MEEDQVTLVSPVFLTAAVNCWSCADGRLIFPGSLDTLMGGFTVSDTEEETFGSATLVAVTDTFVVVLTVGAVNNPLLEIVPFVADHVTPFLTLPVTVALKGWVFPEFMTTPVGVTETFTGGMTVTVAVADFVGSATLVAVTEAAVSLDTTGAV
jgi:hypothetical protein